MWCGILGPGPFRLSYLIPLPCIHKGPPRSPDSSGTLMSSGPDRRRKGRCLLCASTGRDLSLWRGPLSSTPHHDDFLLILPIQVRQHLLWAEPSSCSGFPENPVRVPTVSSSWQKVSMGLDPFSGICPKDKIHAPSRGALLMEPWVR